MLFELLGKVLLKIVFSLSAIYFMMGITSMFTAIHVKESDTKYYMAAIADVYEAGALLLLAINKWIG